MANTTIALRDLGAGIDQQSSENQLAEGYCEDLLNCDPKPEGYLVKRKGYEGYGGSIPLRVAALEAKSPTELCFTFPEGINISTLSANPIIVYGRSSLSSANGDFLEGVDSVQYYDDFTITNGVQTVPASTTSILETVGVSNWTWTHLARSTSFLNNSNEQVLPDYVELTKADNTLDISVTNSNLTALDLFVYTQDKSPVAGVTFVGTDAGALNTRSIPTGGSTPFTIDALTHALDDLSILVKVFEDTGTLLREIKPDEVVIEPDGDVRLVLTNNSGSAIDVIVILSAAPITNTATLSVASGTSDFILLEGIETSFPVIAIYEEDLGTGELSLVDPDTVVIDAAAQTATISFTNSSPSDANFVVYYEFADVVVNEICVVPNEATVAFGPDTNPQLSVWGLPQAESYTNSTASRPGWVTHVDSYRAEGENYLLAGLGGVLHRYGDRDLFGTDYLLPLAYPSLRERLNASLDVGPVFWADTDSPSRTRGYIQCATSASNEVPVTSISYDGGNGWTKYVLHCASGFTVTGALATILSTTSGLEDEVTIRGAGLSWFNGTFSLKQVTLTDGDTNLNLWVDNPNVLDSLFDETDSGAKAAVYTDNLTLTAASEFLPGDEVKSDLFSDESVLTAVGSSGTTLKVRGVTTHLDLPIGLRIVGKRTSSIIPLRTQIGVDDVTNFVRHDMVSYSPLTRKLKVLNVNTFDDIAGTTSITSDGITATLTLDNSVNTSTFSAGEKILLVRAGVFSGVQTIEDITGLYTLTFASSETASSIPAVIKGKTIEVDESIEWEDTVNSLNTISVPGRWLPIEAPDDSYSLTDSAYNRYFTTNSYVEQPFIRSVMVKNNMYFSNGDDAVMKYDGQSIYRAGLFRWQPGLFITTDSDPTGQAITGLISFQPNSISTVSASGNVVNVNSGDESAFTEGDVVEYATDGKFTITSIADGKIYLNNTVTTLGASTMSQVFSFSYYYRLNAYDANGNRIASAVTGSQDTTIQLSASAQVRHRLVGMPAWGVYDYTRLEAEIYRTKAYTSASLAASAIFYRIATIPMEFNTNEPYLDYTDTDSDSVLLNSDVDETTSAILENFGGDPAELATTITHPLRAKYVTSAGNQLVLGNLKDYPQLDIRLLNTGARITQSVLNGQKWQFRIDSEDTTSGTDANLALRARYEFTTTAGDITSTTPTVDTSFRVLTSAPHGLTTGDWVYLFHEAVTDEDSLETAGWWKVTVVDADEFDVTWPKTPASFAGTAPTKWAKATVSTDVPVYLGTDGNYSQVNGNRAAADPYEFIAMRRLANAINSTMRQSHDPWIVANAGNEYQTGQLVIRSPKVLTTTPQVGLPPFSGFNIFVNNLRRTSGATADAVVDLFPSRLAVSSPNFPEVFDNPTAISDNNTESFSAIDINSADGQQITGLIPFFGESAFGSAQKDSIVVVFKENSIYLVNLAAKAAGTTAVQRIESQGLGCTAPYSIASTRDGIIFANESGIFRLTRDLRIEYVGQKLERLWQGESSTGFAVNRNALALAQGTHYALGRQYKLSVPTGTDLANSGVLSYNHTREYRSQGFGSWSRYDAHPVTGWANLETDAFFGSTLGAVYRLRNSGSESDFRDDAAPISMEATLAATDFGDAAIRKAVASVDVHFRVLGDQEGTSLLSSPDLGNTFREMDSFEVKGNSPTTGFEDEAGQKILTLGFSPNYRKLVYFQVKITNATLDEPVEIAGIEYRVSGLSEQGITQAKQTKLNQ